MEKIPKNNKLIVGEQTFEKVGEVEAQKTGFYNSPETEDIYFDIDNGALMSKIPSGDLNYPEYQKRVLDDKEYEEGKKAGLLLKERAENVDVDLAALSAEEVEGLVYRFNEHPAIVVAPATRGGYPKEYELTSEIFGLVNHLAAIIRPRENSGDSKSEWRVFTRKGGLHPKPFARVVGKNTIELECEEGTIQFSFLEVPEAYTKLMERKKEKTTGE